MIPDYARAARMAYKTILSLHIDRLPIDPLMILRHCRNTRIRTYDEVAPLFGVSDPSYFKYYVMADKEALTIRRERDGVIHYELFYDAHGNYSRRRFTLAHELGHIVLKHTQEQPYEEKEADYYAAQLLAPHPLVSLQEQRPEVIADTFWLSAAASRIALVKPRHQPDQELYQALRKQFEPLFEIKAV